MRVLLVQPEVRKGELNFSTVNSYLEPIGLEYIGGVARARGMDVRVEYFIYNVEDFLKVVEDYEPDLIGYSVYTCNYPESLKWAGAAKKSLPKTLNVFGGYHPSAVPEIVFEPVIDFVIVGEGEITFSELIEGLISDRGFSGVKGLAYCENDKLVIGKRRERVKDLEALPLPVRNQGILSRTKQYQIALPIPQDQKSVAQVLFSRGCKYSCPYCSSVGFWGREVYWRKPECIVQEFDALSREFGTNLVYFPDLTFNTDLKRMMDLARAFIESGNTINWWCMARPENITEESVNCLKGAGCLKITFGLETTVQETLNKIERGTGSFHKYEEAISLVASKGLLVRGLLMFGYPWETEADIEQFSTGLGELALDEIRLVFLTPFPGTQIYEYYKGAGLIEDDDLTKYNGDFPLIRNENLSSERLISAKAEILKGFYNSQSYVSRVISKMNVTPYLKPAFEEHIRLLKTKGILSDTYFQEFNDGLKNVQP